MGCNCNNNNSMASILYRPLWSEQNNKPLGVMIEYITSKCWKYAGNCGSCNGGLWYTNEKHEGWRLKISGNTSGIIQQNQNPQNKQDYKNIAMFDIKSYEQVLTKFFN